LFYPDATKLPRQWQVGSGFRPKGNPGKSLGWGFIKKVKSVHPVMAKLKLSNIFSALPAVHKKEVFQVLGRGRHFKIERIVSCGQATPKNKWLFQKSAEWVIVLRGRARLSFEEKNKKFYLRSGDYLFILPHTRHRVDWTHPKQKTIWLAVHLK
jgi:cupin 2 domain-containing protein